MTCRVRRGRTTYRLNVGCANAKGRQRSPLVLKMFLEEDTTLTDELADGVVGIGALMRTEERQDDRAVRLEPSGTEPREVSKIGERGLEFGVGRALGYVVELTGG